MRLFKAVLLSVSFLCLTAAADPAKPVRQAQIKSLAADFLLEKTLNHSSEYAIASSHARFPGQRSSVATDNGCHPHSPGGCVEAACTRLGSLGCNDQSEVLGVARACQGNFDGSCVNAVCDKLGSLGCNDMSEALAVATACKSSSGSCVTEACARVGSLGCNDLSEATAVATACQHNGDGTCVAAVCDRLGSLGCNDLSEVVAAANACGGN